jgi:hypothetical protein
VATPDITPAARAGKGSTIQGFNQNGWCESVSF